VGIERWLAAAALAAAAIGGAAMAEERKGLAVGAEAPDFRLNDHEGRAVRLSDFRGKRWVVLAAFPKAMTPG
jgi:peroxiredoxin Q/BCP